MADITSILESMTGINFAEVKQHREEAAKQFGYGTDGYWNYLKPFGITPQPSWLEENWKKLAATAAFAVPVIGLAAGAGAGTAAGAAAGAADGVKWVANQLSQGTGMNPMQLGAIAAALTLILKDQASQRSAQQQFGQQQMDLQTGWLDKAEGAYNEKSPLRAGATGYLSNRMANPTQGNIFASYLARRQAGLAPGTVSGNAFTPPTMTPPTGNPLPTTPPLLPGTGTTQAQIDLQHGAGTEPGSIGGAADYANNQINTGGEVIPPPGIIPVPGVQQPGTVGPAGYKPDADSVIKGTAKRRS